MAEINIDKMAKDIAEIALDEIFYDGKTIRELMKIVVEADYIGKWIPVSERSPNHDEYIKNNGLFNVSDGNRSYFGWFDIYDTKKFVKPTIAGFRVDNAVIAWMPLPESCKAKSEEQTENDNCNTCIHHKPANPYCECCFDLDKYEREE